MKVALPGGSGQIGAILAREFQKDGHEVVVLSRKPYDAPWPVVVWDAETIGDWAGQIDGADVVVNLAGRSVNCRYNTLNRELMIASRVNSTRIVGEAINRASRPPKLWLQSSSATIYSHRYDAPNDDVTGIIGGEEPNLPDTWRFSYDVAFEWEQAVDEADVPSTRKVKLRSAMVMSPDKGGVFDVLLGLVRHGLGGTQGRGNQYVSWIHHQDFIRAIFHIIEHDTLDGAVNLSSPNPLPNADFMRILREASGTKFGLPATDWMLEIGALALQTETELILKSRRVTPTRLLQNGFTFEFPEWKEAADDLCREWLKNR